MASDALGGTLGIWPYLQPEWVQISDLPLINSLSSSHLVVFSFHFLSFFFF